MLTLEELQSLIPVPLILTDDQAQRIQEEIEIIDGRRLTGEYDGKNPYSHLWDAVDAIAKIVLRPDTPSVVLDVMVPGLIEFFRLRYLWRATDQECMAAIKPRIRIWHTTQGGMRRGHKQHDTEHDTSNVMVRPAKPKIPALKIQLKQFRKQCRMSVEELAEAVGIRPRSVYRHLSGTIPRDGQIRSYEKVFTEKLGKPITLTTSPKRQ